MADHVDRNGEACEDYAIAVAKYHLLAVPESIVVFFSEVYRGIERQPGIIYGIAFIGMEIEIKGVAESVIGFIDLDIAGGRSSLRANLFAWELLGSAGIGNCSADGGRGARDIEFPLGSPEKIEGEALGAEGGVFFFCVFCGFLLFWCFVLCFVFVFFC